MEQINKLNYYEYVTEDEKYYIAAYSPQQADMMFMIRVMAVEKIDSKDTVRYLIPDERAKLLELTLTEPGLAKIIRKNSHV